MTELSPQEYTRLALLEALVNNSPGISVCLEKSFGHGGDSFLKVKIRMNAHQGWKGVTKEVIAQFSTVEYKGVVTKSDLYEDKNW